MTNKIPRKTLKELKRILKIIILEKQEIDCMASSLHTQMNYIFESNSEIFIINYNIRKWLDVTGI